MPDPASSPITAERQQRLRLERDGRGLDLLAVLGPIPGGLQIAGLSPSGQRYLLIQWDAAGLRVEKDPQVPPQVDGGQVLRDVVLAHWPLAALQAALAGSAWALSEDAAGGRLLSRAGQPYLRLEPRAGGRKILHLTQGYSVDAEDLDSADGGADAGD